MISLSVLKLQLNADTPIQSDNIPLFSIYFIGLMLSALVAIGWYQQMNLYNTKKKLPMILRLLVLNVVLFLFRIPKYKQVEVDVEQNGKIRLYEYIFNNLNEIF